MEFGDIPPSHKATVDKPNASGDFSACLNFNWNNNNERLEL